MDFDYSAGIVPGTTGNADPGAAGVAGSSGVTLGTGTGQQGHRMVEGGAVSNPFVIVKQWLDQPFTTPMNKTDVFVLIGTILVAVLLWNLILYHVRIAAEQI